LIVAEHGGVFPSDAAAIAALPGIGPYTAGAIRSIGFDARAPILDGNVARVFARWFCIDADLQSGAARRELWRLAEAWSSTRHPGDANQALMELGALVCTKPVPGCTRCPVRDGCAARAAGVERELPRARRRPATERLQLDAV